MISHIDFASVQEAPDLSSPVETSASAFSAVVPIVCDPAHGIHAPGTLCTCADRRVRLNRGN